MHTWFVRIDDCEEGRRALDYFKDASLQRFIVREQDEEGRNPHYHLKVSTLVGEKTIRKAINAVGVKHNKMWSMKKWKDDVGGLQYMCKGLDGSNEPEIVENTEGVDVAANQKLYWETYADYVAKKKTGISWSAKTIDELTERFADDKSNDRDYNVAVAVCRKFRDQSKQWNRTLQQQIFETVIAKLQGLKHSEEHIDHCARYMVVNKFRT